MDITKILLLIIELLGILASVFIIPWLKSKLSAEEMREMREWIEIGCAAAQQLYSPEETERKKQYVLDLLESKGYKVDSKEVDSAIEAEVIKLHNALGV